VRRCVLGSLSVVSVALAAAAGSAEPMVYWTDLSDGAIYRAGVNGGIPELVVGGLAAALALRSEVRAAEFSLPPGRRAF